MQTKQKNWSQFCSTSTYCISLPFYIISTIRKIPLLLKIKSKIQDDNIRKCKLGHVKRILHESSRCMNDLNIPVIFGFHALLNNVRTTYNRYTYHVKRSAKKMQCEGYVCLFSFSFKINPLRCQYIRQPVRGEFVKTYTVECV